MTEKSGPDIKGALVELRLANSADLDQLGTWLNDPAVYRWWGGLPLSVEEIQRKYTGRRGPLVTSYLIEESGVSVGYIQSCRVDESSCGIDLFLDPAKQGRGLATDAVGALTKYLTGIEGIRLITADPECDNVRALALWRRAGFVPSGRSTALGNLEFVFKSHAGNTG